MENKLELLFASADHFFKEGNFVEALFCYKQVLQEKNASDKALEFAFWGAGESLMNLELYHEAVDYLQSALKINNQEPNYYYLLGESFLKLLKLKEAQHCLNEALNLYPKHPEILRSLGWSFVLMRKPSQGIKILKKSLDLDKKNLLTLCDLAVAYMNLQDYHQSKKFIEEAKKIDPKNPMVLDVEAANNNFSRLHRELSKFKEKEGKK